MAKEEVVLKIPETVKILGISGSWRKGGNTVEMVKYTLKAAESMGYVETEYISLANYKLYDCEDCKRCIGFNRPADDPVMCYRHPDDQGWAVKAKEEQADAVLLGFPIYGWHQPPLPKIKGGIYTGGAGFFNETEEGHTVRARRWKPQAWISQGGRGYGGQERALAFEVSSYGGRGLHVGSWPTIEDPEPQASYMGGMLTCNDGMSVYRKDAWTSAGSRTTPPLTGLRQERTLRNLGRWLAVAAMMMKIGSSAFEEAELKTLEDFKFTRYSGGKPQPGSVIDRLIKEGKVTYVPPEELESRKKIKA